MYAQLKFQYSKIQDGGRRPFRKLLNRHISATVGWIATKFGTMTLTLLNPVTGFLWFANPKKTFRIAKV